MREGIPARLMIDSEALAALGGAAASPDTAALLERVAVLLADVRARLANDSRVLVDQKEAGRLMGCNPKTLENHGVPCVKVGARRMYRPDALRVWAAAREEIPTVPAKEGATTPAGVDVLKR
jgi:hypothetical protein